MAAAGDNRVNLRSKPRRQFHFNASVLLDKKGPPLPCALLDISETGARLTLANECAVPERFVLLFTKNGGARRMCRLVWREGLTIGVEFPPAHP